MSFSLGSIAFDDLRPGDWSPPAMMRDIEAKTGDDGHAVFNTGRRGTEFEAETRYAFASWADAKAAEVTYANAFTAAPVNLVIGGYSYALTGIQFVVVGPPRMRIEAMAAWQGLRSGTPTLVAPAFVLIAVWRLLPVEV